MKVSSQNLLILSKVSPTVVVSLIMHIAYLSTISASQSHMTIAVYHAHRECILHAGYVFTLDKFYIAV